MKKPFIIILSALLLLSCGKPQPEPLPTPDPVREGWTYVPPENGPYEGRARLIAADGLAVVDGYLYFDGGVGDGYVVPMRLNLETGNVTALCPDPVCAHDTVECPLYGTRHFLPVQIDGMPQVLAMRLYQSPQQTLSGEEWTTVWDLVRYDPASGKRTVLETYEGGTSFTPEVFLGTYRFYVSQVYDEEGNWIGGLTRMDVTTGKTELLFEGFYMPLLEKDGRVWVSDGVGFFSFEADHPAPVLRPEFDGTSAMLPEYSRFSTDGTNLYITQHLNKTVRVLPIDGSGEYSLTLDFADYWYLLYPVGGWIYYFSGETTVIGDARIRGYASDKVELYGEEFRRCRPDGSEDQCVFRFEGEWASYRPLHIASDGRYLYCDYSWWEDPDGDGVYRDGDNCYSFPVNGHDNCSLLRIDSETGEVMRIVIREGTK
ncbi:MAG: hypothetical protein IK082_00785 [Oscillospiraceae bacterium]|nr:hypothetical protein [Oscillospiraceae bacterium]